VLVLQVETFFSHSRQPDLHFPNSALDLIDR
jgi:hypothetical protein